MSVDLYKYTTNFKEDSMMQMLFNTLFQDFENIRYFDKDDMYYEGDIVYVPKSISDDTKDYFYECTKNGYKGVFNKDYFKKFVLQNKTKRLSSEFRFVSDKDDTKLIPLRKVVSTDRVTLQITHSVKGCIIINKDWTFKTNNTIELKEGLFSGEYLDITIFE